MIEPEDISPPRTATLRTTKKKLKAVRFANVTMRTQPSKDDEEEYGPRPFEELFRKSEQPKLRSIRSRLNIPKLHRPTTTTTSEEIKEKYMEVEQVIPIKKDLEDGELSSDEDEVAPPQNSYSSESFPTVDSELEIDRIIEETQRLTSVQGHSVSCENVEPNFDSEINKTAHLETPHTKMDETNHSEEIDIVALRKAALMSLAKKNNKEDGEVSDESARTSPCLLKQQVVFNPHGSDGFTAEGSKTPKEKYAGLTIQVRQDSKRRDVRANRENQRKRRHSPSRKRSSARSSEKSIKMRRSTGTLKDLDNKRNQQTSKSNLKLDEINPPKEVDEAGSKNVSGVISHADMVLGEASNSSTDHTDVVVKKPAVTISNDINSMVCPPPPPPPILPSVDRSDKAMFGIQLNVTNDIPLPRPHAPRPHDLGRDNYDSIGMDIDNSDNSRPTTAPGSVTFDDEAERMRKQLLQQLQQSRDNILNASKGKASGTPERPTREGAVARNSAATGGYESSAEESYRANRSELSMVENKIQITLRQMDVIADKRRQLMKEMNALSVRLSDYQMDYLKTLEKRNSLRKDVDIYELDRIRRIRLEDDSFTDSTRNMIDIDNSRVTTMTSILVQSTSNDQVAASNCLVTEAGTAIHASKDYIAALKEHTLIASSEMEIINKLKGPQSALPEKPSSPTKKQEISVGSRARRVSSMTEDELRALLLNNVKKTKARRPLSDSDSLGNQASHSNSADQMDVRTCRVNQTNEVKVELEDEQQDEYLEDDQAMEEAIQDSGVEDANQSSGISSEFDTQPSQNVIPIVEKDPYSESINVNKETERARQIESECGLSVRLHYHAGLTRKFNHMSVICPYEMWGLCKDFSCAYQHLNDSKLPLHTILLMILNYAPDLAGPENSHYGIREKIKKVALMKDDKETARQFVRRLLRRLPQVERTAAFLSTENNQSSVTDDRGDFDSYYGDLHISAAPAST